MRQRLTQEVQTKIVEEVSRWTGLHVASVHVIFKNMVAPATTGSASDVEVETF